MSLRTDILRLSDVIFANAEKITDAEFKEMLDLLKSIKDNTAPAVPPPALPVLPPATSVCCFTALHEAFTKDPSLPGAKTSRCGCCGDNYPVGYGAHNFRAEGKKSHSVVCAHTKKTCSACGTLTPAALAYRAASRLHHREGQNVPPPAFLLRPPPPGCAPFRVNN